MKSIRLRLMAAAGLCALVSAPAQSGMFEVKMDDATIQFGGRLQTDWSIIDEDSDLEAAVGNQNGGHEFRRARLFAAGTLYETVIFKAEYDFAGGATSVQDAYIGFKGSFGTIKMGQQKEPFSLEEMTSSRFTTFLERGLPNAFAPGRNAGITWANSFAEKRATLALGVFKHSGGSGNARNEDDYSISGRVTALPMYEDDGKKLIHLGASVRRSEPVGQTVRYSARPEIHTASRFVDTGSFDADSELRFGLEGAVVHGPFSLQGEYIMANPDSPDLGNPSAKAFYVLASYFLTGESRAYKTSSGAFDRQTPTESMNQSGGAGAWELTARFSQIDLNDGEMAGGELVNFTGGINWYPNPYTRMMLNYVRSDLDKVGKSNGFLARFQVDF